MHLMHLLNGKNSMESDSLNPKFDGRKVLNGHAAELRNHWQKELKMWQLTENVFGSCEVLLRIVLLFILGT